MAFIVTPFRRRLAMAAMLGLAATGAVTRSLAPDPSTLRDVGTLLMVLWLPAIGNLIGYVVRKLPRSAPPIRDFATGAVFAPQLRVHVDALGMPAGLLAAIDAGDTRCTLLVGRRGFTARLAEPVAHSLADAGERTLELELLRPVVALPQLAAGTEFHLLVGTTAVGKGRVVEVQPRPSTDAASP